MPQIRKRRKRVQVGWYCDHRDDAVRTHVSDRRPTGWRRKAMPEGGYPHPHTVQTLEFLHYRDPKKKPLCPSAQPIYVYEEQ